MADPPKKRSSLGLGAAVALLLGLPLAGFAFKVLGPMLFSTDEGPRPIMEITGPRRAVDMTVAPTETRGSSLDLVTGSERPARTGPETPAPAAPPAAVAVQAPPTQAPPVAPPKEEAPVRKAYPKLAPNHGWRSWLAGQTYQAPQDAPKAQAEQAQPLPASAPTPAQVAAPTTAPAAAAPAVKPAKKGYKPPPVSYSASDGGTVVSGLPGGGTLDATASAAEPAPPPRVWTEHSTFQAPKDTAPEANPERALAGGKCPRAGWWKSAQTGYCYYTQANCAAADSTHAGCAQPNP